MHGSPKLVLGDLTMTTFIAAAPTREAAQAYVESIERRWGCTGEVLKAHPYSDGEVSLWRIQTVENIWDVWMRRNADGTTSIYGEC